MWVWFVTFDPISLAVLTIIMLVAAYKFYAGVLIRRNELNRDQIAHHAKAVSDLANLILAGGLITTLVEITPYLFPDKLAKLSLEDWEAHAFVVVGSLTAWLFLQMYSLKLLKN